MTDHTNKLHVEIVHELLAELERLDEMAGRQDAESNRRVDERRQEIRQELRDMGENI